MESKLFTHIIGNSENHLDYKDMKLSDEVIYDRKYKEEAIICCISKEGNNKKNDKIKKYGNCI